ncbi:MAG: response regulator [Vulcanimicrobiota bacterium]
MTRRLSTLLGQFADVNRREVVSAQIARALGAEALYVLVRDDRTSEFRLAAGYSTKLKRSWLELLNQASAAGTARQDDLRAYVQGEWALLVLGGQSRPTTLLELLPLLGSLARAELHSDPVERSDFMAYANHEIRTPMAAMLGYVDILLRQSEDPDDRHHLEIIQRNGQVLLETVNDLFDLSRIRIGTLSVRHELFELPALIAELRNQMEPLAQERGLGLQVFFDTLIPRRVTSDRARLRQVLTNLLSNAIKYTERGWVRLSIRAEGDFLDFAVTDSGVGLDTESLPQLLHTQSIGLSISQQLVGLLGGELTVQSQTGKGSRFSFRLPAPANDLVDGNIELLMAPTHDFQLPDLSGLSVLVVDDRIDIQEIARAFLEEAGASVYTTSSGQTALDFLKKKAVSVVVLDMHMPGMDGHVTARTLRELGMTVPILALTASAMNGEQCLASGCNAYLSKPVDRSTLIGQVWTLAYTLRVLVVEDSPLAAHALQVVLQSMGCTVRLANTGAEARLSVNQEAPAVVLMDLGLPDVDGWELLAWLRQHCPEARVLAHTGRRPEEMTPPTAQLAFDGYLQKPAPRRSLLQSLFPKVTTTVIS